MTPPLPPPDPALDRLFLRYWENALTADELRQLNARLEADPAARDGFRWFCTGAVTAREWAAVHPLGPRPPAPLPAAKSRWLTRRRALAGLGGGLAAGAGGVLLARRLTDPPADTPVRVAAVNGQAVNISRKGEEFAVGAVVPTGETVAALGTTSSVILTRPDGSAVTLSAGSAVTVADRGNRLVVFRGGVSADLPPAGPVVPPLTLGTALAAVSAPGGAVLGVSADETDTEVQVQNGQARVADRSGDPLVDLRGGEQVTVHAAGGLTRAPIPEMRERFTLTLDDESAVRWPVGSVEAAADRPALAPTLWYDPYHKAVLYQIRSNNHWTRGLVRLWADSVVRVTYRAAAAGRGQVCLVVRQMKGDRPGRPATGVLEWNGEFSGCDENQWRTIEVRAADLTACPEAPVFGPPWVAFLLIFNTYSADLGLRVSGLRVSRPGDPVVG